jgi:IclR family mhp operon transcriptional activator
MFELELKERPAKSPPLPKYNDLHCRANSLRGSIDEHKASYAPVESARRVLLLLQVLNAQRIATIGSLHQVTGLSKPTIVRMLETLISEGYVVRDNFVGGYSVTSKVVSLASGFSGAPLLIEAARSRAVALTNDIKWPVSLGTLRDGHILVSFTTAPISPWAYPFPVLHRFLDLELTAMGQCYLAFCEDEERALLLNALAQKRREQGRPIDVTRTLRELMATRKRGYARVGGPRRAFEFVSVPIFDQQRCSACMGVGYYRTAVPPERIVESVVQPMIKAAAAIEVDMRSLHDTSD